MTEPALLPQLRQDLQLQKAAPATDGRQQWLVYDPLQHRFIAIDRKAFVLFSIWDTTASANRMIDAAWLRYGETIELIEVETFIQFLHASNLTQEAPDAGWRYFAAVARRRQGSFGSRLLHNYLFFRIPLFAPERFLRATLPWLLWLGTKPAVASISVVGSLGLYLMAREWSHFIAAASDLLSLEGAVLIAITLVVIKILHELAHAYVATAFGCRVPVMGVAVMMGVPMLYCDVTDAWRLTSRRKRLLVDSAGVAVELAIASIATFLWAFLPQGPGKSVALTLATASWMMSVVINLNPFMRFDGYHIAADLTGIENLQARSFAFGRWRLRELLFGVGRQPPEPMPLKYARGLVVYAWCTWLYRLVLFTGIALAVYHYFFKLAGVILFLVEIVYFIVGPMFSEIKEWWQMRRTILARRRSLLTALFAVMLMAVVSLPWSGRVHVPVILEAQNLATVYAPEAAIVQALHVPRGATVVAGQPLLTLHAPAVRHALAVTELKLAGVRLRLARRTADDTDREDSQTLFKEEQSLARRRDGLQSLSLDLIIKAPFAGLIAEVNPAIHVLRAVGPREPLMLLRSDATVALHGYLSEADLWRVGEFAAARFVPEVLSEETIPAKVTRIGVGAVATLDRLELASIYGGPVPAIQDPQQRVVPTYAVYAVSAELSGVALNVNQTRRGMLVIDGAPESFLARFWRQVLKVLVRESGV
jgi:putative peptide zinc metalloprotease protein